MDLIKAKGLNLQDLLDNAMDDELNFNEEKNNESIERIDEEIRKLQQQKQQCLNDYQKKIDIIIKNLNEFKKQEEIYYDKQIHILECKKEYLKTNDS